VKRIVVIANKWFEADALMSVLIDDDARPKEISRDSLEIVCWPRPHQKTANDVVVKPRAMMHLPQGAAEIWCIQDLMDPKAGSYSNTQEKARVLPLALAGDAPTIVIAFGTGASRTHLASNNGSVFIGGRTFVHNPYRTDPAQSLSKWSDPRLDSTVETTVDNAFFQSLAADQGFVMEATRRFLQPPAHPASRLSVSVDKQGVALSSVNVLDWHQYDQRDVEAIATAQANQVAPLFSLETTHGVICLQKEAAPFLFITGIANCVGQFADETQAFIHTQNFAASHNAGVALAWMLPRLAS
jgi:hypothetical protein